MIPYLMEIYRVMDKTVEVVIIFLRIQQSSILSVCNISILTVDDVVCQPLWRQVTLRSSKMIYSQKHPLLASHLERCVLR